MRAGGNALGSVLPGEGGDGMSATLESIERPMDAGVGAEGDEDGVACNAWRSEGAPTPGNRWSDGAAAGEPNPRDGCQRRRSG